MKEGFYDMATGKLTKTGQKYGFPEDSQKNQSQWRAAYERYTNENYDAFYGAMTGKLTDLGRKYGFPEDPNKNPDQWREARERYDNEKQTKIKKAMLQKAKVQAVRLKDRKVRKKLGTRLITKER